MNGFDGLVYIVQVFFLKGDLGWLDLGRRTDRFDFNSESAFSIAVYGLSWDMNNGISY
jgi:hypothetical protein